MIRAGGSALLRDFLRTTFRRPLVLSSAALRTTAGPCPSGEDRGGSGANRLWLSAMRRLPSRPFCSKSGESAESGAEKKGAPESGAEKKDAPEQAEPAQASKEDK